MSPDRVYPKISLSLSFFVLWFVRLGLFVIYYYIEDICFFRWKIEIHFIEWTPSVIFSRVAQPRVKMLPMVFTRWNTFRSFTQKKPQICCLFHAFNPFWDTFYQNPVQFFSVIPRGVPIRIATKLQYYVKRKKCKVNDVIFPSGCEARAINLGKKNRYFHWWYQCKIEKYFHRYFSISYRKAWNNICLFIYLFIF